jgi:hypothetical protein
MARHRPRPAAKSATRRARPRRRAAAPSTPRVRRKPADDTVITIRAMTSAGLVEAKVLRQAAIERLAEEWTYILRSRTRWADDADLRQSFRGRALDDLERIGVPRTFMKKLASASHVEVELHGWDPADAGVNRLHESAAEVPWEYLLSAGTRGVGRYRSMLITRLFRNHADPVIAAPPRQVLFIESAPGRLEDEYDFESERDRIQAAVGADDNHGDQDDGPHVTMAISATQKLSDLKKRVRATAWDVLHVTGVDTHQATWFIDTLYDELAAKRTIWNSIVDSSGRIRDGMILRETNIAELPVNYEELAAALIDPKRPPSLVTLNLYYSGARTARELVKRGAQAALGFLDEIDDELAEKFFQAFYWEWCSGGAFTVLQAFGEAWRKMTGNRLHGTAIAIWMGVSVFEKSRLAPRPSAAAETAAETKEDVRDRLASTPIGELLQVQLEVPDEVNYSLLHNDRALLTKLTLTKLIKEPLEDITVQVELNLGALNYPFRCTQLVLDEPQLALAEMVRIPLTAALPRSLRERVQSTVYVKVTCGGRTAWETTERVTLIPVDEWVDDTMNNPWLPSFVLPRDPAVLKIISSSRRYLVGIRDDPAAGFDGYQSVEPKAQNPSAGLDAQVQAIWTALVNEYRFQYINPPPAYSEQSQRLRTPSDIVASNSGTCIDLALLLASCLEYVDIYPVVVLLSGHAFAGYWRSEEAHDAFVKVVHIPAEVPAVGSALARSAGVPFVDPYGWRLTRLHYDEVLEYVTSGDLVMLEATYLTSASSFSEAIDEGRADMRSRREFDSLLDIKLARSATPPVTPLPIIND